MKHLVVFALLLAANVLNAQQSSRQQRFISGGAIRMHLEAGGYKINPTDSNDIVVTCHANSDDELKRVKVDVDPGPSTAEIYIRNTPHNNFSATIEVPRRSDLWIRLTAGQLDVGAVEGDKNLEIRAGQLEVAVPDPEQYGHRDAGVLTGSIEASAFHVSKGGLFRSFEQEGSGKYRLHAHVMTGEIDLR
jgi:hypothetical protein